MRRKNTQTCKKIVALKYLIPVEKKKKKKEKRSKWKRKKQRI